MDQVFFFGLRDGLMVSALTRDNLFTPPIVQDLNGCSVSGGSYHVPESKSYTMQSKMAKLASSIPS